MSKTCLMTAYDVLDNLSYEDDDDRAKNAPDVACIAGVLARWQTNCHGVSGNQRAVLFRYASKIAHSCKPNCVCLISESGCLRLRTIRPIAAGDLLTTNYVGGGDDEFTQSSVAARRQRLKKDRKFLCMCDACVIESESPCSAKAKYSKDYKDDVDNIWATFELLAYALGASFGLVASQQFYKSLAIMGFIASPSTLPAQSPMNCFIGGLLTYLSIGSMKAQLESNWWGTIFVVMTLVICIFHHSKHEELKQLDVYWKKVIEGIPAKPLPKDFPPVRDEITDEDKRKVLSERQEIFRRMGIRPRIVTQGI
eukprot:TRINITY_DN9739_c2_g1_i1.p1 TRINITY_DN9739_c2_g1~~TRINITY_DN9739_c2_g1_i1.p1  ORF type:complete len:361 (+),score=32.75 TRINITY_DN9739_c2_g1_i1:155-1084(+)